MTTPESSSGAPAPGTPSAHRSGASRAGRIAVSTVSAVLITITCVLVPVSLLTVWVHDIVLDTDRYVSTVAPLATNPAIETAAANRITQAVDVKTDGNEVAAETAAWLQSKGLPPKAVTGVKALGPKLDEAINDVVNKAATRFVQSDRFETIWNTANRAAHTAVVKALTGEGRGAVEVNNGTVTLDLGTAVDTVKQDLVNEGVAPAAKIPDVNKELVLFQSDKLKKIQGLGHLLDILGNWLPVLTVVLGAIGVVLARRRRRALVTTALGAAAACLILAIGLVIIRHYYLDHLPAKVQSPAAAAAVFDTLLRFLRISIRTALALGVVVALGAYLSGPGRLPRATQGAINRTADSAAGWGDHHGVHTGRFGIWMNTYRKWITLGVLLILALVLALWSYPTVETVLLLTLILLVVLAILALLAASGRVAQPNNGGTHQVEGER